MSGQTREISKQIRAIALDTGFTDCGFAPATPLKEDAKRLRKWLQQGMHAGMQYMENHFAKRTDPALLVPGSKSVIVVLLNYYPQTNTEVNGHFIFSKYALGKDYHRVMKTMLKDLMQRIIEEIQPIHGRVFVDSAPVLERALAALAGLGWIGKNTNLISPKNGSFFFIGELMVDTELEYGKPLPDYCGGCTKCISACPTEAIIEPGVVDSRRCISYWTIEHRHAIDESLKDKFQNRIFGCDICQDVCPWNRKSEPATIPEFQASPDFLAMTRQDWQSLTKEKFDELFRDSAVMRAGYEGLMRNIRFVE